MENKKGVLKKSVICGIIVCLILLTGWLLKGDGLTKHAIELTQLKNNIHRQMMGYIIKTENDKVIVIDGGTTEDAQNLERNIMELGGKVDGWFLTHVHDDHVGAFTQIVANTEIEINHIYVSLNEKQWYQTYEPERAEFSNQFIELLEREELKEKVKQVKLNEKIKIDGIKVEVLGVKNPEITENAGNEQSMVVKFQLGETSLLILGDTGEKSSEKLLMTQREKLKSDIVQVSHHGQAGATKELYEQIRPTTCLWPTPDYLWNNDNGTGENTGTWKTFETRGWMEELEVKEHLIEKDGDITIQLK